ncbi:rhodanese-like domain-containing protein [Streptomyces sp. NPDC003077]|uniref:rhodanese-like domain-containing protein n=1 Tax=Streptomyces sp. NPDC003077 TaxID=3154443 RepID=UPI0033BA5944
MTALPDANGAGREGPGAREIAIEEYAARGAEPFAAREDEPTALLLDVRAPDEYAEGHIPGAVNVPLEEVAERAAELTARTGPVVYLVCRSGRRSLTAARLLAEHGADARSLRGGTLAWAEAGRPLATGREPEIGAEGRSPS